jgi:uncharacterized membrane protein YccC
MFKVFAVSILLLAAVSMSGALAHLCRPPQSHARGPKKFKLLIGTLLGFSVALVLLGLALLKH